MTKRSFPLLLVASTFFGCAFANVQLQLPETAINAAPGSGQSREVTVVVPFRDTRPYKERCGMRKNGYNMDTADAVCNRSPAEWISTLLILELNASGFQVQRTSTEGDAPLEIRGELAQLFVEPVIGFWTGSLEADLLVKIRVESKNGLRAERSFFAKGIRGGQVVFVESGYNIAFRRAADAVVRDMVVAIVELLDDYPGALANAK